VWKTFWGWADGFSDAAPRQKAPVSGRATPPSPPNTNGTALACSNCTGDYEDPDRTAAPDEVPREWEGPDPEDDGEDSAEAGAVDGPSRARNSRETPGANARN